MVNISIVGHGLLLRCMCIFWAMKKTDKLNTMIMFYIYRKTRKTEPHFEIIMGVFDYTNNLFQL